MTDFGHSSQGVDSSKSPKPRTAFTALPPRETGWVGVGSDYPKKSVHSIEQRQRFADQVPFSFYPEAFGKPPKSGNSCGGDNYEHGVCNNLLVSGRQPLSHPNSGAGCVGYYCKYSHEGQEYTFQITSTTAVNCQTGTVIYEPISLTQYSNLRYHTTVTLTEVATTTTSDGGFGLETGLAVIFAGGIEWIASLKPCSAVWQAPEALLV